MNLRRLTTDALLTSLALIIFLIESQIPPIVPIPGIKIGLANAVTLLSVYLIGKKDAFTVLLLRIILGSVFAGNISSLIFSICGGLLSFAVTCIFSSIMKEKMWVVSVFSAVAHNAGQLIAAVFVMKSFSVLWYTPYLIIAAIVSGGFIGILSQLTFRKIKDRV